MSAVSAHLGRTGNIVVLAHVELANRAGRAALQQPLINALSVEEVQAGHGSQFLVRLVLDQADHALRHGLICAVSGIGYDLLLCDRSDGQRLDDRPRCRLDESARQLIGEEALVQAADVDRAMHVVILNVVQDLEQVHVGRGARTSVMVMAVMVSVELICIAAILLHHGRHLLLIVVVVITATESATMARRCCVLAMSSSSSAHR